MSALQRALDFIVAAERCATLDELQACVTSTLAPYGSSKFAFFALAPNPENGARSPLPLTRTITPEWRDRYLDQSYYNSDIVTHVAIQAPGAFVWDDVRPENLSGRTRTVFNEGREIMKVEGGLCVPTHDASGFAGFISLFFDEADPPPAVRRELKIISLFALERAKELRGVTPEHPGWDRPCPLTPRQREALAFMAQGKTDWEIGVILGISQTTAHSHVENAKRKLGARTRAQAVARAVVLGLV